MQKRSSCIVNIVRSTIYRTTQCKIYNVNRNAFEGKSEHCHLFKWLLNCKENRK